MKNFWQGLQRPFTVLAPLDGVTDVVFRQIITEIGKPDVLFTEFTMCEGLLSKGRERVLRNLAFTPEQQPIIAQIWGTKPDTFYQVAKLIRELGFTGIDINMGCPERVIIKHGACSALIKTPELAAEIIQATKEGSGGLPVSVKTRIGFKHEAIDEWIGFLLKQDLAALTVHLRTAAEMSKVPAHWEHMPKIIAMRDELAPQTPIIGNGDIQSLQEIEEKHMMYGCDGYMVGRGIFTNPWLFNRNIKVNEVTIEERIDLYLKHIRLFEKTWGPEKNTALLKKFCKTYINNFPDVSQFREQLMTAKNATELSQILEEYRDTVLDTSIK